MKREAALARLLTALFSEAELRTHLAGEESGDEVQRALPGPPITLAALGDEAVAVLKRRGLVRAKFFERLVAARPLQAETIEDVRALWKVNDEKKVDAQPRWVLYVTLGSIIAIGIVIGSLCWPVVSQERLEDEPPLWRKGAPEIDLTSHVAINAVAPVDDSEVQVAVRKPAVRFIRAKLKGGESYHRFVAELISVHLGEFEYCYGEGLRRTPGTVGTVVVEYSIRDVAFLQRESHSVKNTTSDREVGNCFATVFRRWSFPRSLFRGNSTMQFEFELTLNS